MKRCKKCGKYMLVAWKQCDNCVAIKKEKLKIKREKMMAKKNTCPHCKIIDSRERRIFRGKKYHIQCAIDSKAEKLERTARKRNGKKCITCGKELTGVKRKFCTDLCTRKKRHEK